MLSQEQDAIIIKSLPKESGHRSSISGITTVSHWHWPSHLRSINLIFLSLSIGFFPIFPLLALHGTCQDQTTWRWLLGKGHHLTKPYPTVTPSTPHSLSVKKVFLFIRIWHPARGQKSSRNKSREPSPWTDIPELLTGKGRKFLTTLAELNWKSVIFSIH